MAGKIRHSVGVRLMIIAFLSLVLLIPAVMIQSLIHERQGRQRMAVEEISQKWGSQQILTGPILTIPYLHSFKENNKIVTTTEYLYILPDNLVVKGKLDPAIRYRGIYKAVLYHTNLQMSGNFPAPDLKALNLSERDMLWQDAFLAVGITDMKGIQEQIHLKWDGIDLNMEPGVETKDVIESGIHTGVPVNPDKPGYAFSLNLSLNGSKGLNLTPVGKITQVVLSAPWGNPSFIGEFLPDERTIADGGFEASWNVLHLNRNYPQQWIGSRHKLYNSAFGVDLLFGVDTYQKTIRTAKYAIMFIGLTFLAFFMIELLNKKVLHPIQYLLIGFALLVFYTLLLSLSEHISFGFAYILAALGIVILITAYTKSVLKDNRQTGLIFGILLLLYSYLYIVLQLQDYALLMGSIGLFVILALVMYLTRHIDWYTVMRQENEKSIE